MLIFKWLVRSHTLTQNPRIMFFSIDSVSADFMKYLKTTNLLAFCIGNFYQKYLSVPISVDNSFDVKTEQIPVWKSILVIFTWQYLLSS